MNVAGRAHRRDCHRFSPRRTRYMAAAHRVIMARVWLLQEKYRQITSKSTWVSTAPTASRGMVTARRLGRLVWSMWNHSAMVSRALRKAVSPEDTGHTTTPTMASAPPASPSRDTETSYTTPDCPSWARAFCSPPVEP